MKSTLKNGLTVTGAVLALIAGAGNAFAGWSGTAFHSTDDDPNGTVKNNRDSIYNSDTVNAHTVVVSVDAQPVIPSFFKTYTVKGYNPGGTVSCVFETLDLRTLSIFYTSPAGSTSATGFYSFTFTANQPGSTGDPGES